MFLNEESKRIFSISPIAVKFLTKLIFNPRKEKSRQTLLSLCLEKMKEAPKEQHLTKLLGI